MKSIIVNSPKHGQFEVFVSDEDYDYVSKQKWYVFKTKNFIYIMRMEYTPIEKRKQKMIFMHREIAGVLGNPKKSVIVDHKNRNTLDNTRENLRICTESQNQMNKCAKIKGRSKYLGVWYNRNSIVSKIRIKGHQVTIGQGFKTEEEAARAYDAMAKIHHGEFANLNFKNE